MLQMSSLWCKIFVQLYICEQSIPFLYLRVRYVAFIFLLVGQLIVFYYYYNFVLQKLDMHFTFWMCEKVYKKKKRKRKEVGCFLLPSKITFKTSNEWIMCLWDGHQMSQHYIFYFPKQHLGGGLWSTLIFQLVKWDQLNFASSMGPAAVELLAAGLEGYATQSKRVEELFGKIWPPPNVWDNFVF